MKKHRTAQNVTRRDFLGTTVTVGAAAYALGHPLRALANENSKLNHACIGVGGMGWNDLHTLAAHPNCNIVAICDVDENHLNAAAAAFPNARKYTDWRELLTNEGDKIDSVNASVPDHMHYLIAMSAIKKGKHVYCQKPLCHDVAEVRDLTEAAIKAGVVTQLGTQHASGIGDRMAVQMLRDGAIGKIKRVVLCSNRPGAIETYRLLGPRPAQGQTPPAHLHWDLWLGSAPERPFAPGIYHPTVWRAWQDFGTGWSGDIGCHVFDAPWRALDLHAPISVIAQVQDSWKNDAARRADTWPQSDHMTWIFPGNDMTEGDTLQLEWFDGLMYPPEDVQALSEMTNYAAESMLAIGTEGVMHLPHGSGPYLFPSKKFEGYARPDLPGQNHYHLFVDACLGGAPTKSHFAQTGPMTEAILLGTVAIRMPDQKLEWDAKAMRFTNNDAANGYLKRQYREGWQVL